LRNQAQEAGDFRASVLKLYEPVKGFVGRDDFLPSRDFWDWPPFGF